MYNYKLIPTEKVFSIEALVTIYYFEYDKFYRFGGETHDFWEFLYVDKGSILATAEADQYPLRAGDIIFHGPGEFHDVKADGISNPNIVVVSFLSKDLPLKSFRGLKTSLSNHQRLLLMSLIKTAVQHQQDNRFILKNLVPHDPIGIHRIQNQLELFLLSFVFEGEDSSFSNHLTLHANNKRIAQLKSYICENLSKPITIRDMTEVLNCSDATLYNLIKVSEKVPPIQWMNRIKMTFAKDLLRDDSLNITQVAESLGYSSIHYFSKVFKALEGMSPKAYVQTIKCKIEAPN